MPNVHTRSKSGFITRSGVRRRETLWFGIQATANTIAGSNTAVLFAGLSATLLALRPFTVVRTRAILTCTSDQTANSENAQVGLGVCVVSDQALAIGVTAVPTPFTDVGSDLFFVYETLESRMLVSSAVGIMAPASVRKDIDSKAMRKVEEGQDIAFTLETSVVSEGVSAMKAGRMLIKLH